MSTRLDTTRYTFWKDHFRYFVRSQQTRGLDPAWDTDGATSDFVFPPTDGIVRWRLPSCLEVIPGKEAGEIDVDVAWLDEEPTGIYDMDGVASACDIATPGGVVVITDHGDQMQAAHDFGAAERCRVFIEVIDRDVSGALGVAWGAKTSERHVIAMWPAPAPMPQWTSDRLDDCGRHMLHEYRSDGIDPEVGQRQP